ncbi:uncharacterized protein Rassf [Prorops nasuta]|uniref:uncharacterized protein Rassf n=1 Tax=Prorops nasuta TaxID=863751 RepID=UPI0034CD4A26
MWKCHKCGKPVYFAERKQSLGYDWHPECLRCEECGKRLNPGQHAEHKSVPYCYVPCYGALFGPQLFGHGTRVESHTSFGKKEVRSSLPRTYLDQKLKIFNQYYEGKSGGIRSREVNGRLIYEGALRIYWGVRGVIHLKEDDDQRTVVTARHRNSCRRSTCENTPIEVKNETSTKSSSDEETVDADKNSDTSSTLASPDHLKSLTLPMKLDVKTMEWDELDELLQVERKPNEGNKLYQTMPENLLSSSTHSTTGMPHSSLKSGSGSSESRNSPEPSSPDLQGSSANNRPTQSEESLSSTGTPTRESTPNRNGTLRRIEYFDNLDKNNMSKSSSVDNGWLENKNRSDSDLESTNYIQFNEDDNIVPINNGIEPNGVILRRKQGSTAIRRRPGGRRQSCGKLRRRCSINGHFYNRETSFFTPPHGSQMSVWVTSLVNTQEVINLMLDKYKVDAKPDNFALFVVRDNGEQRRLRDNEYPLEVRVIIGPHENVARLFLVDKYTTPEISFDIAQYLNLSLAECQGILRSYSYEEERQVMLLKEKYKELRKRIKQRMEELKVRL